MVSSMRLLILSDVHYAGATERGRAGYEARVIGNPVLRAAAAAYRHWVWLRDPFAHNALLTRVLEHAPMPDAVVANGDFSCDSAFIGHADDASCDSARECLGLMRARWGDRLLPVMGDHELGKMSLFGGVGGPRLRSWERSVQELGIAPVWRRRWGRVQAIGVTSTLLALDLFQPELLEEERAGWEALRREQLAAVSQAFGAVEEGERILLFCHDPSALTFLAAIPEVRARLGSIERTVIGHLHSSHVFRQSQRMAGWPQVRFLGNTVRRLSGALSRARAWAPFKPLLCPSLAGLEWWKDGGYWTAELSLTADAPVRFEFHPLPWFVGKL